MGPEEIARLNLQFEQTPCQKAKMDSPVATFLPRGTNRPAFPPVPLSRARAGLADRLPATRIQMHKHVSGLGNRENF